MFFFKLWLVCLSPTLQGEGIGSAYSVARKGERTMDMLAKKNAQYQSSRQA